MFVKAPKSSFEINPNKELWSMWEWRDVVADWTWPGYESKELEIEVYRSYDSVELF